MFFVFFSATQCCFIAVSSDVTFFTDGVSWCATWLEMEELKADPRVKKHEWVISCAYAAYPLSIL